MGNIFRQCVAEIVFTPLQDLILSSIKYLPVYGCKEGICVFREASRTPKQLQQGCSIQKLNKTVLGIFRSNEYLFM